MHSEIESYVAVVEAGSVSGAARRLELPVTTVSRRSRAWRSASGCACSTARRGGSARPTSGGAYFERCARLSLTRARPRSRCAGARRAARHAAHLAPPTNLRATAMEQMISRVPGGPPGIEVELDTESRYVDLVAEGYDVALRGGRSRTRRSRRGACSW
jgi:DNA-binding transcriptional LysR family regulator